LSGKGIVLAQTSTMEKSDCEKKLLDPTIVEHRGHIAPMLTFNTVC